MLCDSNILIYAADPADVRFAGFVERTDAAIATVSRIEVLGFQGFAGLSQVQQDHLCELVESMIELRLDESVVQQAISLRRKRRMSLADAVVAATAIAHGLPLVTRNVHDFRHIAELTVINPFADIDS